MLFVFVCSIKLTLAYVDVRQLEKGLVLYSLTFGLGARKCHDWWDGTRTIPALS